MGRTLIRPPGRISRILRAAVRFGHLIVVLAMSYGALQAAAGGHGEEVDGAEPTRSGDVRELSLQDSILLGLQNNRSLINAQTARVAERFALEVAENKFTPHVTFGPYFDWSDGRAAAESRALGIGANMTLRVPTGGEFALRWQGADEETGTLPQPPRYTNELTLTFTQPLLRGAGVAVSTASVKTARLQEEISLLALKATVTDVITAIVQSYHRHIRAERRADIAAGSLDRARELLKVDEALIEAGRMAERDIVQTQADIARRELNLISAEDGLEASRLALIDILDIDGGTRLRLTERLEEAPEPVPVDETDGIEMALLNRPDYLQALLGVTNAETQVMVARNERLWDLSLQLSASASHADGTIGGALSGLDRDDYGVTFALEVPNGAAQDVADLAHVNAVAALRQARTNLDEIRQRVDIEVSNAVRAVALSARQVSLAQTARHLAEQKSEIEREKLLLGLSTNFQLVAFENDLVAAQNQELEAIVSYHDATTVLDRTLGVTLESWGINFDRLERSEAPPAR